VQANLNWYAPDPWWTFVPRDHFYAHDWNHYIYDRPVRVTNITNITNVYIDNDNSHGNHHAWYEGPRVNEVERYNRGKVRTMEVVDNDRAENIGVHRNSLNVYRPAVAAEKRSDYRPTQYRNIEVARNGNRIDQSNPRANDPGNIRTRGVREDARNITKVPVLPNNDNNSRDNRVSPRTSGQAPNSRNTEVKSEQNGSPRNNSQQEQRNGSINRETRTDPHIGTQVYPDRNSSSSRSVEQPRETPNRGNNSNVNEKNSSANNPARVENPEMRQSRNSAPDLNKVYSSPKYDQGNRPAPAAQPTRDQGNRQAPAAQPTREQRTPNAAPAQNSRQENRENKQATREVKKEEKKQAAERESRGNPEHR
jgi:hypothetical protein